MAQSTKKQQVYDESSIRVLEGLEAVRLRPGMYIGSNDSRGLHYMIWEILDNAVDEALAGYCNLINIVLENDGSVTITDNGRGIPIGMNKEKKRPTPELVYNELHAGGKFDDKGYEVSGGLHGVGSSVVNALCDYLTVTINRDGKIYTQTYRDGGKKILKPEIVPGLARKTGTSVHYKVNKNMFTTTVFEHSLIAQRAREAAYLIKGLTITFDDLRDGKSSHEEFHFENGISEFLQTLTVDKQPIHEVAFFSGENSGIKIDLAIQYCAKQYSENILSFVNNVRTKDGGSHEVGFRSGVTRAFNEHARMINALKDKDANLEGTDTREGITAIISIRVPEPMLQFEGQTKNKLGTPEAKPALEQFAYDCIKNFMAENGKISEILVQKAITAWKAREASRKARDEVRLGKQKSSKPANLLGKLTPAQYKNPEKNELFIVEGESAGGSAKQGRDRTFQAILPLRGKVLNTCKSRVEEMLQNEEIVSIINAIGSGYGKNFDITKSNYDKIIIMTDADTDGAHIQTLLLTFFYRFMHPLIDAGRIYIATPPLYKVVIKNETFYAWTDEELREMIGSKRNVLIQRYKGLGEMNAEQLWETTMEPGKRTLIRVQIVEDTLAEKSMNTLMGDDVEPRREWIENNVDFDVDDNFILEEMSDNE